MFVVQNQLRPAAIQNALHDLMRDGLSRVRICSAYLSRMGSQMLLDAIERSAPNGDQTRVYKTIVTSLDFGLTEPRALKMWHDLPATEVFVAGTSALAGRTLRPEAAFHPKFYVFDRPDGTVASLVTSANLTNRGLTMNSEVGWAVCAADAGTTDHAWHAAIELAVPLTEGILEQYEALRESAPDRAADDMQPVPQPLLAPRPSAPLSDASINPGVYSQLWVQSFEISGGSATQLELPRGTHRFFGIAIVDYERAHVNRITEPTLVAGNRKWEGCQLRWHGNNRMERINLPSVARGGFSYAHSLILFRRLDANIYELHVHPWDSDTARACIEASQRRNLLFRVGQTNTSRLAGLIE